MEIRVSYELGQMLGNREVVANSKNRESREVSYSIAEMSHSVGKFLLIHAHIVTRRHLPAHLWRSLFP
jgi:hypothetical protein